MTRLAPAAVLAALLIAPLPVLAQDWGDMQQGLSMLELSADRALEQYGIDVDPRTLRISQLAAIHAILTGGEDAGNVAGRIEAIVRGDTDS